MAADNTTRHLASRSGLSLCLPADCTPSRAVGPCLPTAAAVFLSTQRWRHKLALRSNSLYGNCLIFLVFRASGRCPGCGMYKKLTRWAFTVAVTCPTATGQAIRASHSFEYRDWTSDRIESELWAYDVAASPGKLSLPERWQDLWNASHRFFRTWNHQWLERWAGGRDLRSRLLLDQGFTALMAAEDATQSVPDGEVSRVFGSASVSLRVGDFLDFDQIYDDSHGYNCKASTGGLYPITKASRSTSCTAKYGNSARMIYRPKATSTSLFVI